MKKEVLQENDEVKDELDDDDVEIVVREEGANQEQDKEDEKQSDEVDDKQARSEDPEDGDEDDEPDEEDEESIRERRRREKLARKERREKAIHRDKVEMNFLRSRNEELERRMMAQEMRSHRQDHYTVEQQIAEAENDARTAEQVIAKAIAEANGDDATLAIRIRDEALEKIRQLTKHRDKLSKEEKQMGQKPQGVDPIVNTYAQEWMSKNTWYDGRGVDLDSRLVLAIDQSLVDEGYVPRTPQYWKELDRRVRDKLPHRYESDTTVDDDDDEAPVSRGANSKRIAQNQRGREAEDSNKSESNRAKKGPPTGQSSESVSGQSKKREVYISPERKEALIQAGVWDDPVLRMRYVKQYQKWDKENASR